MTAFVRKIDELGRIVLPMEFRKELNMGAKCDMRMEIKDGTIVLTPNECLCKGCGEIISPKTKYGLCERCIARIKHNEPLEDEDVG